MATLPEDDGGVPFQEMTSAVKKFIGKTRHLIEEDYFRICRLNMEKYKFLEEDLKIEAVISDTVGACPLEFVQTVTKSAAKTFVDSESSFTYLVYVNQLKYADGILKQYGIYKDIIEANIVVFLYRSDEYFAATYGRGFYAVRDFIEFGFVSGLVEKLGLENKDGFHCDEPDDEAWTVPLSKFVPFRGLKCFIEEEASLEVKYSRNVFIILKELVPDEVLSVVAILSSISAANKSNTEK